MYEGCPVELQIIKMIREGVEEDKQTYFCEILEHDPEKEYLYLLLMEASLDMISMDGVYECRILDDENKVSCHGMVKERFRDKRGNLLVFQIENGFYKNNLN